MSVTKATEARTGVLMETAETAQHPMDRLLRKDRLPHIWCSTCGIGTVVKCFAEAIDRTEILSRDSSPRSSSIGML